MTGFLVCILTMTSVTMAAAKGQSAPVGAMVICAGQGSYTVLVDAEGQPTGAVHLCPDCALSLFDTSAIDPFILVTRIVPVARAHVIESLAADPQAVLAANARGPPVLV